MSVGQIILYYLAGSWGLALLTCLPVHRFVLREEFGEIDQKELSQDEKQLEAEVAKSESTLVITVLTVFAPLAVLAGVITLAAYVILVVVEGITALAGTVLEWVFEVVLKRVAKVVLKGAAKVSYPQDATSRKYLGGYAKFSGE